ncbi:MAG: SHOCT domain-containing protein [Xanthobacteraceae bacterium]
MMKKLSTLPLLVFVVLVAPLQAMAQQQPLPTAPQPPYIYWPGPMWGYGGGFQFWWICPLMMLFMFLIFGIIFFFVRRSWADGSHHWGPPWHMMHGGPPTHSALQILNERFARGEIQKDEYEEKKATILSGGQH